MAENAERVVTIEIPSGVVLARLVGTGLGLFLILMGVYALTNSVDGHSPGQVIKNSFFIGYGGLLALPWRKIKAPRLWKRMYILFAFVSVAFPFVLIFQVMFHFMDLVALSQQPGAPTMEGTLIFLGLMQIPTVLFVRRPELLD